MVRDSKKARCLRMCASCGSVTVGAGADIAVGAGAGGGAVGAGIGPVLGLALGLASVASVLVLARVC